MSFRYGGTAPTWWTTGDSMLICCCLLMIFSSAGVVSAAQVKSVSVSPVAPGNHAWTTFEPTESGELLTLNINSASGAPLIERSRVASDDTSDTSIWSPREYTSLPANLHVYYFVSQIVNASFWATFEGYFAKPATTPETAAGTTPLNQAPPPPDFRVDAPQATLKSISFLDAGSGNDGDNEHTLYENSSSIGGWGVGLTISDPVWACDGVDANTDPDRNRPVCYTRTTPTTDSKMKLDIVVRIQRPGLKFDLVGLDGTAEYFRKNAETSSGADQTVTVVASQNLPSTVDKLSKSFRWKVIFTDPAPDLEADVGTTIHDVYVVYDKPIESVVVPQITGDETQEDKPTPKRLDFCVVEANTKGKDVVHGTIAASIAQTLQRHIAISIFDRKGFFQKYPTPSPVWEYVKTKKDGGIPEADCIQQSAMLAAGLGQLGIRAGGDRAYPTSDNDCDSPEIHPTVVGRRLRYVTSQNSDDTSTMGDAYPNNFQATAWVKDASGAKKYYTMWKLYPPQDTLLAVLQYEKSQFDTDTGPGSAATKYLQYWSYDEDPTLDPNRFIDETLHPKGAPADWPPVWNNPVPLP